jgi:cell wall-associated NlpC family hydrolase
MRRTHACIAVAVSVILLLATPGLAAAEPANPGSLAQLIAAVADANQKLRDIGEAVQARQEGVNKAINDVATARENADAARADVETSGQAVKDANTAIAAAQDRFDNFAAATYVNGPSGSYLSATSPDEMIATATAGHTVAASAEQVVTDLQRARTEQVNKQSAARAAQQKADTAVADAQRSQDDAVGALTDAQHQFGAQQAEIDRLLAERDAAQQRLAAARATVTKTAASTGDRWEQGANAPAPSGDTKQWDAQWDPTLPAVPSAFVSGDPIAIINSVLGISSTSAQVTQNMGRQFLQKLGLVPTPTGYTNGAIPRVYGRQASEYVIQRAMSQRGVPYSWGGGNAAGPSRGIDDGAGTVGFDCSGLILYAFAGVGIKLPHYSGSQYNMGRKIPSSQMRRGDVIFYGPGGAQHVTLYLGDGQMLEAPYTGSDVHVSPVRASGMTPYVVRYIEY